MDELTRASKEARSVPEAPIDMEYIGSIQGKYEEFHITKKRTSIITKPIMTEHEGRTKEKTNSKIRKKISTSAANRCASDFRHTDIKP